MKYLKKYFCGLFILFSENFFTQLTLNNIDPFKQNLFFSIN